MKILDTRVYPGPNVYALYPVVRMTIDLQALEHRPTSTIEGFVERLMTVVPTLADHCCCFDSPGGFLLRLREGTWMGHVLEHVAIALQNLVGDDVTFGKTRGTGADGHYDIVFACRDVEVGRDAGDAAFGLLHALLPAELSSSGPDVDRAQKVVVDFMARARARALGPSTAALVRAAESRGIPWRRMGRGSLIQLGHGRHLRRLWGTVTARTSAVGVDIACDKSVTHDLLAAMGLPVPRQGRAATVQDAAELVAQYGLPVVLKPCGGNHGRGVVSVRRADELTEAFEHASRVGPVLVEEWLEGSDHRLLVVGGRLIAAAMRVPGQVVGDGVHTLEELVEEVNADPRRGAGHDNALTRLRLDDEARRMLIRAGVRSTDIPAPGRIIALRETANLSTGGTSIDVTDVVHPDNVEVALAAARVVDLDVAGVDFITPDIRRSYRDVGGGICEVNAGPGLRMHLYPTVGRARDVAAPIIDVLFPSGRPATIPIAMVTGTNGKTTTTRMLGAICEAASLTVGMTTTDGVYVGGRCIAAGDWSGPGGAARVIDDPRVEVAVLEVGRGGLLRAGLGAPWCDVGAVTNVAEDHLGMGGIDTLDELAHLKSVVVEAARDTAVLNADDPHVRQMWERCRARRAIWISQCSDTPFLARALQSGHAAVTLRRRGAEEVIVAMDEDATRPVLRVPAMPASLHGVARHNVENAMFATGMAWAMGIPISTIREALERFECNPERTPGRLNVFEHHPFRVIVDYGHNAAGFRRIGEMVSAMPTMGRRICVAGVAGDRRDQDFEAAAAALSPHFDLFVCRGEDDTRGRGDAELPQLMAFGLRQADVDANRIVVEPDELEATRIALRLARPGDLVVVFAVRIQDTCELVRNFASSNRSTQLTVH